MEGEKIIGIVGGVGPYAGLDLMKKVFDETAAANDQEYLPVVMISESHKIADRTSFLLGKTKTNPAYALAEVIKKLVSAGATVVGIPCNTAHSPRIFQVIEQQLQKSAIRVTLLHMIEEVAKYLTDSEKNIKKIGVLSTTGTYKTKVYPQIFERFGLQTVVPEERLQKRVHLAIYDPGFGIKSQSNPVDNRAKEILYEAVSHLQQAGAEAVVLGCTEIPLAITERKIGVCPIIDPTWILAKALIRAVDPKKLMPF